MDRLRQLWLQWSVPLVPGGLVGFERNLAATLIIAVVAGWALAPRLGFQSRVRGAIWVACLLVPLAYTLTPTGRLSPPTCDLDWTPWLTPRALANVDTRSNLVLLIPAGAATLLLPAGPRRIAALCTALALPVAIELTQMFIARLGRGCQLGDVINNQTGVLIGFWWASGLWVLVHSVKVIPRVGDPPDPHVRSP